MAHFRVLSGLLLAGLVAVVAPAGPALALDESDRLFLVGGKAFDDGLYPLSRRMLERFVEKFPTDPRAGDAMLVLGKARLSMGASEQALDAFKKALAMTPVPGKPQEARFWEAETLFKMKRYNDARTDYARVTAAEPPSPLLPDALYGLGWTDLELKKRDAAVSDFRRLIKEFPDHATAPPAAIPFPSKYPDHALVPDSRYYLARAKIAAGNTEEGVAQLRTFTRTYPNHELVSSARRAAVDSQLKSGKKKDIAEEYTALMAQKPATPEALYDAGALAAGTDRPKDVEAAWGRLRKEGPDHALAGRASLEQAQAVFAKNNFKDAAALGRVAAKSSDDAVRGEAFLIVGESEMKLRRPAPALTAFQAAADTPGLEPALRYRALAGTGLAYEDQKQWAQAAKYYDEVAAGSPDKTLSSWAKTRRAAIAPNLKPTGKKP